MGGERPRGSSASRGSTGSSPRPTSSRPGDQAAAIRDWIAPALPHLDYLLPNDEQVLGLSGESTLEAGCRALLELGVGCVAATAGRTAPSW